MILRQLCMFIAVTLILSSNSDLAAQPSEPSVSSAAELIARIELLPSQKSESKLILQTARAEAIRLQADVDLVGLTLRSELESAAPDESKVGTLIQRVSTLEGQMRKSRIFAWLHIQRLLTSEQRMLLKDLEIASEPSRRQKRGKTRPDVPDLLMEEVSSDGEASLNDPLAGIHPQSVHGGRFTRAECAGCHRPDTTRRPKRGKTRPNFPDSSDVNAKEAILANPFQADTCDEVTCSVDSDRACCQGTISIATHPYAAIYIDGRKVGFSPVIHKVSRGPHHVRAVFADGSPAKSTRIHVTKGAKYKLVWKSKNATGELEM